MRLEAEVGRDGLERPAGGRRARRPRAKRERSRERGETRRAARPRASPVRTAAASVPARARPRQQLVARRLGWKVPARRHRLEVALLESVRASPRSERALAPAARPRAGCRGRGRQQHVVAADQPLAQPLLPGLGEERVRLRLVGHPEAGQDAALERPLLQDGGAQGVDGRDARALQDVERGRDAGALVAAAVCASARARSSRSRRRSFMRGGRVLGEGDRRDLVEARGPARTSASMRSTSSVVLPVPAPASQHQARGVVAPRPLARLLVDRAEAVHRRPSAAGTPAAPRRGS